MNTSKTWNYQITEATDEKATVTLSSLAAEGSVYLAGTKDYSIGQKITLAFTEDADYQFVKWDYDSSILYTAEPGNANTTATVLEKTTSENPTQIKAVCAPRLRVTSFSPVNNSTNPTVSKNSSIVITFNQTIPSDEAGKKQLDNISIAVGGSPVKSSFLTPDIADNVVTFRADNSNMLNVPAGQTKTVTVSIPADLYYQLSDGTKVTYGASGKTFDYKIDETTLNKAEITVSASAGSGTLKGVSGYDKYSIGQEAALLFEPADGWQFNGWSITCGGQEVDESKIKIEDKNALSTKFTVYEALQGVTVSAKTSECLAVTAISPSLAENPKDSKIEITFNKNIDSACSEILDKIQINNGDLDTYYTNRSLSGNKITIENTLLISVPKNTTKIITVTIPSDFYYMNNGTKVSFERQTFSFKINNTTIAKTKVNYSVIDGETGLAFSSANAAGVIEGLDSAYKEYNIGEEVPLSFALADGYQFYGWKITDTNGTVVTDTVSYENNTSALSLQPTLAMNKAAEGLKISAVCYKRPSISTADVSPYNANSAAEFAKNNPISLTFAHVIEEDTEQYIEIKYSVSSFSQSTYFSRTLSADKKTVTFTPIKMLPVENAFETVTVTVPHDKVYYLASDGKTKITPSDEDFSWSYRVNSSTLTKTIVRMDATEASGSVIKVNGDDFSTGDKQTVNIEQSFDLEYPVANGYIFGGWKISSALTGYTVDPAGFITSGKITVKNGTKDYFELEIDSTNSAKAKITSKDAIGNGTNGYGISVYTKDIVCPVVESVKINNITNIFNVTSTGCDSKIYINFSKPIDTDTATLSRSGEINITKFGSSNSHYETYFTSAWSSDNKQLVLSPTNEVSKLVSDESDNFSFIISLNANKKEIKDTEGCPLIESAGINNSFDISYTVNGVRETTKPVFYNTQYLYDKEASATRKNLYATAFSSWGSTASYYTTNHIKDSVYFNMYGYDADSGLKALRITETYYKTVAGENTAGETKVKEYTSFAYSSEPTALNGIVVYRFSATHKLLTDNEGIIKLDFQLIDNAGNASLATTYYVIKDVSITAKIKFENWKDSQTSFRTVSGTTESITLTPLTPDENNKQVDVFYSDASANYSTEFNISSIKYGYSKDSITNSATKSGKNFNFTHDVTQVTYVSITYSDGVGNSKTILRAIPCKPVWDLSSCDSYPNSTYNYRSISIGSTTGSLLDSLEDSIGAGDSYLYRKTVNASNSSEVTYDDHSYCYEGKNYKIYPYHGFYFDGEYWTSVSDANKYLYVSMENDVTSSSSPKQFYVYGENSSSSTLSKPANMPSYIDLKVTPIPNSGLCKVYVVDNLSSSYTWTYIFTEQYSPFTVRTFDSRTAYLPSRYINTTYNLKLKATNSSGATWTSDVQSVKINYQGSIVTSFELDSDTTPPHFPDDSNMWTEPSQIYSRYKMEDDILGKGMYTNEKGLGEFTYYFIPSKTTSLAYSDNLEEYSLEELNAYTPHTTTYEIGKKFKIPFLDLAEGKYTSYIVAKDSSGNTVTKPMLVFNKLMNKSVKYEIVKSSDYYGGYGFIARFDSADEASNSIVYSYRAYAEGQWVRGSLSLYNYTDPLIRDGYVDTSTDYSGLGNKWYKIITLYKKDNSSVKSGYYYVDYMYPSYYINKDTEDEITCKTKNIVSGGYGFQIFCDAPTFAHVVYYPSKLTQTNKISDIPIWETKGCEENFIVSSESFTYGEDQFELIPEGMYYAVIVHFADGSKAMSEIRQK